MSFTAVGTNQGIGGSGANTLVLPLTPHTVGNFFLAVVATQDTGAITVSAPSNITWTPLTATLTGVNISTDTSRAFIGVATSTANVSTTFTVGGTGFAGVAAQEFSSTAGGAAVVFDKSGLLDNAGGTNTWPLLTPANNGELYFGFVLNNSVPTAGGTSGYVYNPSADGQGNGCAYNLSCPAGVATGPVWSDSGHQFGIVVLVTDAAGGAIATPQQRGRYGKRGRRRRQQAQYLGASAANPPVTITATQGGAGVANGMALRVVVLTQAAATQNGAIGQANATQQAAVTTTQTGSRVYGAAIQSNVSGTPNGSTTQIDDIADATNNARYLTFKATSLTGTPGAATIGDTNALSGGCAVYEVLTAGTLTEDPSGGVASTLTAQTVNLTINPPPGSELVALVSSNGGTAAVNMTVSGGGVTWTPQVEQHPANAGYAGVWTAQLGAVAGSATLLGTGSLTATPYFDPSPVSLSGTGSLTATPVFAGSAILSGTGSLTASPGHSGLPLVIVPVVQPAQPPLPPPSHITAVAQPVTFAAAALSGTGSLTASPAFTVATTLSGTGTLTASPAFTSAATLSGTGTLTASPVFISAATLSGTGTLTIAAPGIGGPLPLIIQALPLYPRPPPPPLPQIIGSPPGAAFAGGATLTGSGTLTAVPYFDPSPVTLSGTGTLSATAPGVGGPIPAVIMPVLVPAQPGPPPRPQIIPATSAPALLRTATLSGSGTLTATPAFTPAVTLSGTGTLTATPAFTVAVTLSGSGTLTAAPAFTPVITLTGTGTLSAAPVFTGTLTLTGTGTLSAVMVYGAVAPLTGIGTLTTVPAVGGTGTGLTVFTVRPAARWVTSASPAARWVTRPGSRWAVQSGSARWDVSPVTARWVVKLPFKQISAASLEYVFVNVSTFIGNPPPNPTSDVVQMAFNPATQSFGPPLTPPVSGDWKAASWVTGASQPYIAQCLIGPGGVITLTAGIYDVWIKITDSPEIPAKYVDQLTIY